MPYIADPIDDITQNGRRVQRPDVAEANRARAAENGQRARVLAFIERHIATHVNAPTVRQIAEACGYRTPSAVTYHLSELMRAGALVSTSDQRGAIRSYTTPRALEAVRAAYEEASTGGDA